MESLHAAEGKGQAIDLHLAGWREDGDPIPPPVVQVQYVDVAA